MANVVLIHTVSGLDKVFGDLADELAPGLAPRHVIDESLLNDTIAAGTLTDDVRARFRARAEQARADGADVIMLTCSSVGPAADGLQEELGVRVLRVDEAMADKAVALGSRVGVAATLPTTLEPTAGLVRRAAERASKDVVVTTELAEGAFATLRAGDAARHDELVQGALRALAARVDVIVLAQASMARALAGADSIQAGGQAAGQAGEQAPGQDGRHAEGQTDGRAVPVLTSPRLGMERLRDVTASAAG